MQSRWGIAQIWCVRKVDSYLVAKVEKLVSYGFNHYGGWNIFTNLLYFGSDRLTNSLKYRMTSEKNALYYRLNSSAS